QGSRAGLPGLSGADRGGRVRHRPEAAFAGRDEAPAPGGLLPRVRLLRAPAPAGRLAPRPRGHERVGPALQPRVRGQPGDPHRQVPLDQHPGLHGGRPRVLQGPDPVLVPVPGETCRRLALRLPAGLDLRASGALLCVRKMRAFYFFGNGKADGTGDMKDILGGKGAGLAEMSKARIPVPPGFTIATFVCMDYYKNGRKTGKGVDAEQKKYLAQLEKAAGKKLGD